MGITTNKINSLLEIDEFYYAPIKLFEIIFDKEKREILFKKFLKEEKRIDFDWFAQCFEEEHADRKTKKQDFTPGQVTKLIEQLVGNTNSTLDVCAGTGGIVIQKWYQDMIHVSPFEYYPSNYFYQCEELSDRALPFLLFNLCIRGMNAIVIHGDSLSREVNNIYFIQNDKNDFLRFSSLNVMPRSQEVEHYFNVKSWKGEPIIHIESELS
ncbi:N-6 DNA methylase, partial [Metaclostridioides mangenotii]